MSIRFIIATLIISAISISSCKDYSNERKEVADLMDQLDEAKQTFAKTDPALLPMSDSDIKDRLLIISEHYQRQDELIGLELGLLMADFQVFRKVFKGLPQKRKQLEKEMELTLKQLQDLDKDLKEKNLDKDQVTKYLDDERLATRAVTTSVAQLDTLLTRGTQGYLHLLPRIDSVLNSFGAPQ